MEVTFKSTLTAFSGLLLPSSIAVFVLRLLGHKLGKEVRIGFSIILAEEVFIGNRVKIGHFNLINVKRLVMLKDAYIGRSNIITGPFSVILSAGGAIGNGNKVTRGIMGAVVEGPAILRLGTLSKITANHRIDCTCSVSLGRYTTIAGINSQLWTHGYVHSPIGSDRYRIDGGIRIGNNVYIGSGSIITAGVRLVDGVMIGAGTTVSKSIQEPGLYVSSKLRRISMPLNPESRKDLSPLINSNCVDRVYKKTSN